jgi:hypothetical protein
MSTPRRLLRGVGTHGASTTPRTARVGALRAHRRACAVLCHVAAAAAAARRPHARRSLAQQAAPICRCLGRLLASEEADGAARRCARQLTDNSQLTLFN